MYRVLLVEDEIFVRIGLKHMINWEKYNMQVFADVSNGKEAYEAYQMFHPDILITDIKMPIMDGMELIQKIRETDQHIRIVILTCLDEFAIVQKALSLGVTNYILKLTTGVEEMENVVNTIKEQLDSKEPRLKQARWLDVGLIKEQLFEDFLYYKTLNSEEFTEAVGHFELRLSEQKLCVIRMSLPNYNVLLESHQDMHGRKVREIVLDILENIYKEYGYGEAYRQHGSEYVMLFSFNDMDPESTDILLQKILNAIKNSLSKLLNTAPVFGISSFDDGYQKLHTLLSEAQETLNSQDCLKLTPKLSAANNYINLHYTENISLQTVADHLGVTPNYLSHIYLQSGGECFTDVLNKLRVEKAKGLLANPSVASYQVGESVGLPNASYFIKVFKKYTGLTPKEYRYRIMGSGNQLSSD